MTDSTLAGFVARIVPFSFLRSEDAARVALSVAEHRFDSGAHIPVDGESLWLIRTGAVEAVVPDSSRRMNLTEEEHFFGEREVLFSPARALSYRAVGPVVALALPRDEFLRLFRFRTFALAFGTILRERQGIFSAFDRFKAELLRGITRGHVALFALIPLYKDLEPALHPHAKDHARIDITALIYAVRRLPDNVTRTFAYLLTDEMPAVFAKPDRLFAAIPTAARRRSIWEMLPGKNVVLIRHGVSDLTDLITNLCLYAVEARKIRNRLQEPELLPVLARFISEEADGDTDPIVRFLSERLPFSREEAVGLVQVWGRHAVDRLYDVVRHRELFQIDVKRQQSNYLSRRSELWTQQIGVAMTALVGAPPSALPVDLRVHIISSNTHSVINCLNPLLTENGGAILDWGRECRHELVKDSWDDPRDLVYALLRDYLPAHPDFAEESLRREREWGVVRLSDTPTTGIQVQLIDASRLAGLAIDPGIVPVRAGKRDIIVNIDYAFGEQAEHIIQTLVTLFGASIASVNFLGKAGALQGDRGDVIVPTAFIKQSSERYLRLPSPPSRCIACLRERLPGRRIHEGPMLTVDGTLLQNRMMLEFYKLIWGCVGIEMEGAHYYRRVRESMELGIIDPNAELRFFYYVSDLPMDRSASLATRMGALEGIPPLYAITREILSEIFQDTIPPGS